MPDWRERETWACGPAGLLDALTDRFARAGARRAAAPRALPAGRRRCRRRGRGRPRPLPRQRQGGRVRRHDAAARGRRAGRRAAPARLPHGHLQLLHRAPALRRRSRPAHRRRPARRRPDGAHVRLRCGGARRDRPLTPRTLHDHALLEHLTPDDLDDIGRELDAIRDEVMADLGERDAAYIRKVVKTQRSLEGGGTRRAAGVAVPARVAGGNDRSRGRQGPREHGARPQRDARPVGLDARPRDPLHDLGVGQRLGRRGLEEVPQLRAPHLHQHRRQGPRPRLHAAAARPRPAVEAVPPRPAALQRRPRASASSGASRSTTSSSTKRARGASPGAGSSPTSAGWGARRTRQIAKDYVAWPLLSGPSAVPAFLGNLTANVVRNVWTHTVIFCGHFPDGAETFDFDESDLDGESRGAWYVRQLLGSCNVDGSAVMHLMTGHLSYQIEHHLFPDLPSNRYAEVAPRVRALCERYGLPYVSGPLPKQYAQVVRKILRMALPGGSVGSRRRLPRQPTGTCAWSPSSRAVRRRAAPRRPPSARAGRRARPRTLRAGGRAGIGPTAGGRAAPRGAGDVAVRVKPGPECLRRPVARRGLHAPQRCEPRVDEVASERVVGDEREVEQVLVGARQRVVAEPAGGVQGPPGHGAARRLVRARPLDRRAEHAELAAQADRELPSPPGPSGSGTTRTPPTPESCRSCPRASGASPASDRRRRARPPQAVPATASPPARRHARRRRGRVPRAQEQSTSACRRACAEPSRTDCSRA